MGVELGMAYGETPATFVTPHMQLSVASSLISNTNNLAISTPRKHSGSDESPPSKLILGPGGLNGCPYVDSYAQISALEWSSNPYRKSQAISSPLFRLSTKAQPKDALVTTRLLTQASLKDSVNFPFDKTPAYTITLQFTAVQNFNFTAPKSIAGKLQSKSNFTIPACTLYNGSAYVPCGGCNISSYTNHYVTYGCFEITQLCRKEAVKSRKLIGGRGQGGGPIYEGTDEAGHEEEEHGSSEESVESTLMRSLAAATSEFDTASTYGMLVQSVAAELSDVLSSNPFALDPQKSIVVLTFMGCLSGGIVLIILYLMGLDRTDSLHKNYVQRENDAAARKHLEYDLKHGGKGDLGDSYQQYSNEFISDKHAKTSLMSSIRRTKTKLIVNHSRVTDISDPEKALAEAKAHFANITGSNLKYADVEEPGSDDDDNSDIVETDDENIIASVVTEFLYKLFPGKSLFENNSVVGTVYTYHGYFCMFAGSELTKTRAIRFLNIVALILTVVFADTIFFGIFFPSNTPCTVHRDKVIHGHKEHFE